MHIFRFGWPFTRPPLRQRRLARVLRAACRDPHYGQTLRGMGGAPALDRMPFTRLAEWNHGRRIPGVPETIAHPLKPELVAAVPEPGGGRYTAIAAPAAALLAMAGLRRAVWPQAEFAVLALERPGDAELSETSRDLLWNVFQAPIYRVLLGFDGALLGHECEAQNGLHATSNAIFEERDGRIYVTSLTDRRNPCLRLETGLSGVLDDGLCECGRPGARLTAAGSAMQADLSSAAD